MLNGEFGDNRYNGIIEISDPNGKLRVNGLSVLKDKDSEFDLVLQARDLNVSALKLTPKYKNSKLGFNIVAKFRGNNLTTQKASYLSIVYLLQTTTIHSD